MAIFSSALHTSPGLANSDGEYRESATHSRERRRVAMAVRHAVSEVEALFMKRLQHLDDKMDKLLEAVGRLASDATTDRVARLETLVVCTQPSVDEVLDSMLLKLKE